VDGGDSLFWERSGKVDGGHSLFWERLGEGDGGDSSSSTTVVPAVSFLGGGRESAACSCWYSAITRPWWRAALGRAAP
jgi:hypothetical protein